MKMDNLGPIFYDCEVILEDTKHKDLTGEEKLFKVPYTVDLGQIQEYRVSVGDDGEEPYTFIVLQNGSCTCINVSYDDFNKVMKKTFKSKIKI